MRKDKPLSLKRFSLAAALLLAAFIANISLLLIEGDLAAFLITLWSLTILSWLLWRNRPEQYRQESET